MGDVKASDEASRRAVKRFIPSTRLEAFSDGVLAIAITLLVFELKAPLGAEHLLSELGAEWPSYLGYFVSFAFIGGVWIAHSYLTHFIKEADAVLLRLNLLLLLFVSLLPFTTGLLANHLDDSGKHLAVVVFGINLTLASLMINVLTGYAARKEGLAADDAAEDELAAFEKDRRVALGLQAVATAVGILLPLAAVVIYLVISILILFADPLLTARRRRRLEQRSAGQT